MEKVRILFLSANPKSTTPLAIDEEIRAIEQRIRASEYRDSLQLIPKLAVRPDDVLHALMEYQPAVIHFSGHGSEAHEILLTGDDGLEKPVNAATWRALFKTLKDRVRVVVFNACFSRGQADAVREVIDCVIGMGDEISDDAAIAFSGSFYRAIGFGRSVQNAFDQGNVSIMFAGTEEEHVPELLCKKGIDPSQVVLVQPPANEPSRSGSGHGSVTSGRDMIGNVIIMGNGNEVRRNDQE